MKSEEELTETILKPRDNLRLFLHKKFYYSLVYQKALNELRHPIADIIFDQIAVSIYWEVKMKSELVKNKVRDRVWNQAYWQVREQVSDQVLEQVRGQVSNQVLGQVWDQVSRQIWRQVWGQVENEI